MIVDCLADLHGHYPNLEGGDLLVVAGDLTSEDKATQYDDFAFWLIKQEYKKKIVIGGNHDNFLVKSSWEKPTRFFDYLRDSGTEFEGLKIWGSPWTTTFKGMNPHCKAFTCKNEAELTKKFETIPDDIDILVTHSPPWGIFDECVKGNKFEHVGSRFLRARSMEISPKLHVFGHIHEHGGKMMDSNLTKFVNASHVDEWYRPINRPVRVIL